MAAPTYLQLGNNGTAANNWIIKNNDDGSVSIQSGNAGAGTTWATISAAGQLSFTATTDATSATTGTVTTLGGMSAAKAIFANAGVRFPASDAGAVSDVNTLDDYEEGTWSPTLVGQGSPGGSVSYTTQEGTYTKIGKLVTLSCRLVVATSTLTGTFLSVGGFPFTASANQYTASVGYWQVTVDPYYNMAVQNQGSTTFAYVIASTSAVNTCGIIGAAKSQSANFGLQFVISYQATA